MKERILFERHMQRSVIHNPMMDNALDTQELEIRKDPLTGAQSVFSARLEDKVNMFYGKSDTALIEKLARESESSCFLCGDKWKQMTPTYPEEVVPGGRIQSGQAVLFPNLFPVAQVHAVIRVGDRHYVPLGAFVPERVQEGLEVALALAARLDQGVAKVPFLTINGNYLGPAGASIAHPHFQVVGGDLPPTYLETLLAESGRYFSAAGSSYWEDLVAIEKEAGERYIGNTGPVAWVASFSPQGTNEVLGILTGRKHFLQMDESDLKGLAEGFSAVLRGYDKMGISTFNFAVYSGPMDREEDAFRCHLRIISRQNVYENYRTDDYFLQKLLRTELILTPPEILAATMREAMG